MTADAAGVMAETGPFERVLKAVGRESLRGATIVEIGPGDHIPMAMLLLAAGAARYICLDRFDKTAA